MKLSKIVYFTVKLKHLLSHMTPEMWTAIAGSWRQINQEVENDVRASVKEIIHSGGGIIAGGALNVDYIATDEAFKVDPSAQRVKIFLPTRLDLYSKHYRKRAKEGVITQKQAEDLIAQLESVKSANPESLIENTQNKVVNNETYFERITKIVDAADALIAFHVNKSPGTQNTIEKAKKKGIPVRLYSYTIKNIYGRR